MIFSTNKKNSLAVLLLIMAIEKGTEGVRRTTQKNLFPIPCLPGFFPCNSSDFCVEQRRNCDRTKDCPDGSDEWHCEDRGRKDYYDSLFRKRPDEDQEKKIAICELGNSPVICRCSQYSLFCNHQNLNSIPDFLPHNVKEIDFSGNKFEVLERFAFPKLLDLKTLILTSSVVTLVRADAFGNLENLEKLYLTNNKISVIINATFSKNLFLKLLVLSHNPLSVLSQDAFQGLTNLYELDLRDCKLASVSNNVFHNLVNLKVLWLDGNGLEMLPKYMFQSLSNLQILSLSRNNLRNVAALSFADLYNLRSLSMSKNKLFELTSDTFGNMSSLLKLDLHKNEIRSVEKDAFFYMGSLESLNLKNNPLKTVLPGTFDELTLLKYIYFDDFHMCSLALKVRVCEPRGDGISSLAHLLDSVVLRVSVWVVACVASVGNVAVLVGRLVFFSEPNEVHSFYIKNLSLADLLMSTYLFIIAAYDVAYRGEYILHETTWRHSWQCNFCGFLSTLSSESSVFILTIITTDRYTSILYPLSLKRRTITSASVAMISVWSIAILLSALPMFNLQYYGEEFYGNNGVCLPLHIHDPYGQAWEYSTFLFCGVNLAAFLFILFAYISMFFTISHSRIGLRSTQQLQDRTIAKRFAFIVGTDFLCWVPIVLIKVIAMSGVEIQQDLYAWVAVFLLPVNSALNPVLYTLTTKLFKQHLAKIVYSCRVPSTTSHDNSGISLTSMIHNKGSKKTLVTTYSEMDNNSAKKTKCLSLAGSFSEKTPTIKRKSKKRNPSEVSEHLV